MEMGSQNQEICTWVLIRSNTHTAQRNDTKVWFPFGVTGTSLANPQPPKAYYHEGGRGRGRREGGSPFPVSVHLHTKALSPQQLSKYMYLDGTSCSPTAERMKQRPSGTEGLQRAQHDYRAPFTADLARLSTPTWTESQFYLKRSSKNYIQSPRNTPEMLELGTCMKKMSSLDLKSYISCWCKQYDGEPNGTCPCKFSVDLVTAARSASNTLLYVKGIKINCRVCITRLARFHMELTRDLVTFLYSVFIYYFK